MNFDANMVRSMAEPIVLNLVAERPMYGYEIIKIVNERTKGAFEWKEGTLYPCLHRLEASGLIESEWQEAESGRQRKYYQITRRGSAKLKEKVDEWSNFSQAVNTIFMRAQEA